ncbi:PREDICTED: uncharacterized protein LOC107348611 [Acropora digitifera]|uniref:uncharacterized protein LOC107348611 n=1 Tax=Acropora digitifera TaxID=70779 RepID=UPI00077A3E5A|nr:PREDICTED: uncharacterized protein LOC107348611 [Acropora digitifera]
MGDVSDQEKLKVALMKCSIGAATPQGSSTVVQKAVRVLGPKAVFSVGTCISLGLEKARIGDVVISSRLTTTGRFKTPASPRLGSLALDAPFGWKAPLKHPDEREITVHCNGDILSLSLREKYQSVNICEEYPEAIAIETEGEGVYAAAYDANIEWVIVKGVASYFHQSQSATSEWMSFSSAMAASVVARMLNDPVVFREWPHYNQETSTVQHQAVAANYLGYQGPSAIPETVQQHSLDAVVASCSGNGRQGERQEGSGDQQLSLKEYGADSDISKVVELLKREYNRRADFSPLLWSKRMKLQLKEVYTKLTVVSEEKEERSEIDVDDIFGSSEENTDPLVLVEVRVLKREKKNANLTRMLNQLALSISEENYDKRSVAETIERLDKLRDEVVRIIEELETVYSKLQDEENERKTSKEIEEINEQVDRELGQTRVIILTHVSSLCQQRNVVSREKEYVHSVRETERSGGDKRESNRVQREERRLNS